ncbi:unnamed protein product, partial [Mycena citricolor]
RNSNLSPLPVVLALVLIFNLNRYRVHKFKSGDNRKAQAGTGRGNERWNVPWTWPNGLVPVRSGETEMVSADYALGSQRFYVSVMG